MTDDTDAAGAAWFAAVDPGDIVAASDAIREGDAEEPADWPALAVDAGFAEDEAAYYDQLREATVAATREAVQERERADDQQLIHAIRGMTTWPEN